MRAYTRMLANHAALSRAEVEQYYRELMKIRETNPDIREHYDGIWSELTPLPRRLYEEAVRLNPYMYQPPPRNQRYRYFTCSMRSAMLRRW